MANQKQNFVCIPKLHLPYPFSYNKKSIKAIVGSAIKVVSSHFALSRSPNAIGYNNFTLIYHAIASRCSNCRNILWNLNKSCSIHCPNDVLIVLYKLFWLYRAKRSGFLFSEGSANCKSKPLKRSWTSDAFLDKWNVSSKLFSYARFVLCSDATTIPQSNFTSNIFKGISAPTSQPHFLRCAALTNFDCGGLPSPPLPSLDIQSFYSKRFWKFSGSVHNVNC